MPICRAVLFDCGGVLFDFDQERRLAALAEASGLAADRIKARIWNSGLDAAADRGEISLPTLCERLNRALEKEFNETRLIALMTSAFTIKPDVLSLARQIRADIIKGTLTNNGPLIELGLGRQFPELVAAIPHHRYFSFQFGETKPARTLFQSVAVAIGLPGPEILFVDDSKKNIDGAQAAGWQAIRFTGADELAIELHGLGLLTT